MNARAFSKILACEEKAATTSQTKQSCARVLRSLGPSCKLLTEGFKLEVDPPVLVWIVLVAHELHPDIAPRADSPLRLTESAPL